MTNELVTLHVTQKELRYLLMGCSKMRSRAQAALRKRNGEGPYAKRDQDQVNTYTHLINMLGNQHN